MNQVIDGVLIASAVISLWVTLYLWSLTRTPLKRLSVKALSTKGASETLEVQDESKKSKVSLPRRSRVRLKFNEKELWAQASEAWKRSGRPGVYLPRRSRVRRAVGAVGAIVSHVAFAGLTVLVVAGIICTVGLFVVYLASTIAPRVFLPQISLNLIFASAVVTFVVLGGALLHRASTREPSIDYREDLRHIRADLRRFGSDVRASREPQLFRSDDTRSYDDLPTWPDLESLYRGKDAPFLGPLFLDRFTPSAFVEGLFRYRGAATLPKRVYEGDSHGLTIDLQRAPSVDPSRGNYLNTSGEGTIAGAARGEEFQRTGIDVQLQADYLEAELMAAGVGSANIVGETTQRRALSAESLSYYWNCRFPYSGTHHFAIVLSKVSSQQVADEAATSMPTREVKELLGRIEHTTTVVRLDHMTKRQVKALATVFGFVAALSGMTGVAKTALDVGHHFGWW